MQPETRHMFSALPKSNAHQYKIKASSKQPGKFIRGRQLERKTLNDCNPLENQPGFHNRYERKISLKIDSNLLMSTSKPNNNFDDVCRTFNNDNNSVNYLCENFKSKSG
jgi:hypothetical protein